MAEQFLVKYLSQEVIDDLSPEAREVAARSILLFKYRIRRQKIRQRAIEQAAGALLSLNYETGKTITISEEVWKRTIDTIEYFYPIEIATLLDFPDVTNNYMYPDPELVKLHRRKALRRRALKILVNRARQYWRETGLRPKPSFKRKQQLMIRIEHSLFDRESDLRFFPYPLPGVFDHQLEADEYRGEWQ